VIIQKNHVLLIIFFYCAKHTGITNYYPLFPAVHQVVLGNNEQKARIFHNYYIKTLQTITLKVYIKKIFPRKDG
jgi:cytochrome b subunit of formate dehydrogenase